ncbi:MAG: hypothetical protein A3G34_15130 [Candidatus Lindowbacteria bacterium RIFCSPLOWO2_12_FULL_62_27]|nr:MAG: hypothetical protein A3G34_15130 [Candidatus Lindowbacteria bacterium RIFCSPLOWO2_12_FULL_62_27]OGH63858.1 MAG: hypothetical protein A3I06_06110 [Candidatus Lindowbacteria bacterium RIFCSPLOWO2_02_FULL_62_12]
MPLLVAVAMAWWIYYRCADPRALLDIGTTIDQGRRVNVLILSPGAEERLEAAVMISYEPLSKRAVVFHVPTALCLDGTAEDSASARRDNLPVTLESAYARVSIAELEDRVRRFFGLDLSFTAILPANRFYRLVDLMGGIWVNVPSRISFRSTTVRPLEPVAEWMEIPEGEEVFFDSDKSRMYLAYRYDGLGLKGQLFRARRVAIAFLQRLKPHLEETWFRRELVAGFSNAPAESVLEWARAVSATPLASIDVQTMPGQTDLNSGVFWLSPAALKQALPRELKPLIQAGLPQSRIVVQILNGSGAPNIAAKLRELLTAHPDIDVVEIGNAARQDHETTQIIDRSGHLRSAERIRDLLGAGALRQDLDPKALLDVTVVIGRDYR